MERYVLLLANIILLILMMTNTLTVIYDMYTLIENIFQLILRFLLILACAKKINLRFLNT